MACVFRAYGTPAHPGYDVERCTVAQIQSAQWQVETI